MPESKGKHLSKANREVVEDGVRSGSPARRIAAMLDVAPSTVIHEVKVNRSVAEPKRRQGANLAVRCTKYNECQSSGTACKKCSTKLTTCKHCKTRSCIDSCPDFELKMCPKTVKWPYVCPSECGRRRSCSFPKCRYDAADADASYRSRLSSSREGITVTPEELEAAKKMIAPLLRRGQSFEAIWATHSDELPFGVRTAYAHQASGLFGVADPYLPRKVRRKAPKKPRPKGRDRVDRTGRTYDDFKSLALTEQVRVVQCDSVEGYDHNVHDVLSMHMVARAFQIYLHKKHADPAATVAWIDVLERSFGTRGAFEAVCGILLCDRGVEFDDWEGLERSCLEPGHRRCRVFYCDAMNSNQKPEAERNHEQLRRILPKGRSDFDRLSAFDVAVCCSHVNSYPSAGRSDKCPFELLGDLLPKGVLDELGLARISPDDVTLAPSLMAHAVVQ